MAIAAKRAAEISQSICIGRCVVTASVIAIERVNTIGCIVLTLDVGVKRVHATGRVIGPACVVEERFDPVGRVIVARVGKFQRRLAYGGVVIAAGDP